MMSRHRPYLRARLTREGWYYLAVLTFIVAGAALTHVNLLVMLGGMMLAPLLVNWRLAIANVRDLRVRRRPLQPIHAGQPLLAEFEVANPRRWLAAWVVVIEESWTFLPSDASAARAGTNGLASRLRRSFGFGRANQTTTSASTLITCLGPGENSRVHYELLMPRRGCYRSESFRWRSTFPLGLVEAAVETPAEVEILVKPRIARLTAEWSQLISSAVGSTGEWKARQRANEGDYFAVRPWQIGDSPRWMHWRTTARTGRPMVRQFEQESSSTIVLVLDPFLPPEPTNGDRARLEAAISFTATALADLAERDVGELALLVANAAPQIWRGPRSTMLLEHVMSELGKLTGDEGDHRGLAWQRIHEEIPAAAAMLVVTSRQPASADPSDAGDPAAGHTIVVGSSEFNALFSLE